MFWQKSKVFVVFVMFLSTCSSHNFKSALGRITTQGSWITPDPSECFPKIMVPQNGWFIMENPINMDDLGVPILFGHIHLEIFSKVSRESDSAIITAETLVWPLPDTLDMSDSDADRRDSMQYLSVAVEGNSSLVVALVFWSFVFFVFWLPG